jgi:hypothetical protein
MLSLLVRKWILVTGIVFLVLLLLTFALEDKAIFIWDIIMNSWFPICQALTPIEWQTKGNILRANVVRFRFSSLFNGSWHDFYFYFRPYKKYFY